MDDKRFVALLPENLQLKILSLVTNGEEVTANALPAQPPLPAQPALPESSAESSAATLAGLQARVHTHGFGWQDAFVGADVAAALLAGAQALQPALTPAGMSSSVARWRDPTARGDLTAWLPFEGAPSAPHAQLCASAAWAALRQRLQLLVTSLNRTAAAEGRELVALPDKAMIAHYPTGARYVRHSDVSPAVSHRRLTAILYLNADWREEHGGQLVLFGGDGGGGGGGGGGETVVAPNLGRLLLFRSNLEHEVRTTHQPRWAITTWIVVARQAEVAAPPPAAAAALPPAALSPAALIAALTAPPPAAAAALPPATLSPAALIAALTAAAGAPAGAGAERRSSAVATTTTTTAAATSMDDKRFVALLPENLQLKILSLVTNGEGGAPRELPAQAALPAQLALPEQQARTTTAIAEASGPSSGLAGTPEPADGPAVSTGAAAGAAARIFVSVASYRDPECPHTLLSLFTKAARPERLVVGVCFQCGSGGGGAGAEGGDEGEDGDEACVDLSLLRAEWRQQVRSVRMPWREARGPVWARHLVQRELYDGEEFYLQIDSHSRFVPGWDERLVAMLARCGSPKAVLSTYPLPYEGAAAAARVSTEERLTLLCTRAADAAFDADGMLRFRARLLAAPPCAPVPTAFWAAGFSFSRGELVREVHLYIAHACGACTTALRTRHVGLGLACGREGGCWLNERGRGLPS